MSHSKVLDRIRNVQIQSYSQCCQDLFALIVNGDRVGTFIDIGCNTPSCCSNVALLIENGWQGICIDNINYTNEWKGIPQATFYQCDGTNKKQLDDIFCPLVAGFSDGDCYIVDYLSLDIDDATLKALENIDFNKFKFRCITIEHDAYHRGEELRPHHRKFLRDKGYHLLVANVNNYEDWWVHPDLTSDALTKLDFSRIVLNELEPIGPMATIVDMSHIANQLVESK